MQSETADFAPVPPLDDLDQTTFCLTLEWCRHLANWRKHTRRIWFEISSP